MINASINVNQTTLEGYLECTISLDRYQLVFHSAFNVTSSIVAILGNILILVPFRNVSARALHPPSKLLFECLAYTDLAVGLFLQPVRITTDNSNKNTETCWYGLLGSWILGPILCGVSLLTLTVISTDRLLALTLGLRYRQKVTLKRVRLILALCWLVSSATELIALHSFNIALMMSLISTVLNIASSTFCYITIFVMLFNQQARVRDHIQHRQLSNNGSQLNISRFRKTVKSALWVQLTLLVCFLPFGVENTFFVENGFESPFLTKIVGSLVCLNSAINPIIYSWK